MNYILNALPGACLPEHGGIIAIEPITWAEFAQAAPSHTSAVGHADTAAIISTLAGVAVPMNRVSVPEFRPGDSHLLALYRGPRLPEGATQLPDGATLAPYRLTVAEVPAAV